MNNTQTKILWTAIIFVVIAGVGYLGDVTDFGFRDLCIIWFMIVLVAAAWIYTERDKPKSKNDDGNNNKGR